MEAESDPVLELSHLSKSYGSLLAVDDLSLSVQAGELYVLLGPNGAGKTTSLKLAVGLLSPDRGEVRLSGRSLDRDGPGARQSLGYIPDRATFYEELTVEEFLSFLARLHRVETGERATRLLERFRLGELAGRRIRDLSQGMRQKLSFCACFLHCPRVAVVDEPWVGLDPLGVRGAIDFLGEVTGEGVGVLLSTHTLSIAEEIADRIGVMHRGRLVGEGKPEELLAGKKLEHFFLELTEGD